MCPSLWQAAQWQHLAAAVEGDEKRQAKFLRLMGIKDKGHASASAAHAAAATDATATAEAAATAGNGKEEEGAAAGGGKGKEREDDEEAKPSSKSLPSLEEYLDDHAPNHLKCPILDTLFKHPVILMGDGYTYEQAAIEAHLDYRRNSKWFVLLLF